MTFPVKTGIAVFHVYAQIFYGIYFCSLKSQKVISDMVKHMLLKHICVHSLNLLNFAFIFLFYVETAL